MVMEDDRKGYIRYLFEIAADIAYCYDEMNNPEKYGLSSNESKHDYYNRLLRIKKAADNLKKDADFLVERYVSENPEVLEPEKKPKPKAKAKTKKQDKIVNLSDYIKE